MILDLTTPNPLSYHWALCSFPQPAFLFIALSNLLIKADLNTSLPMPFFILYKNMYRSTPSSTNSWDTIPVSTLDVKIIHQILPLLAFPFFLFPFLPIFSPSLSFLFPSPSSFLSFFHSKTHFLSLTCLVSSRTCGEELCLISIWNENRLYEPRSFLPAWLSQRNLGTL